MECLISAVKEVLLDNELQPTTLPNPCNISIPLNKSNLYKIKQANKDSIH